MRSYRAIAQVLFCVYSVAQANVARAQDVAGTWLTTIGVDNVVIALVREPSGTLVGTLAFPDRSADLLRLDVVSFDGDTLHIESQALGATFDGELQDDSGWIAGLLLESGTSLPVTLRPQPVRPQEPQAPFPYGLQEVSYDNALAGVTFGGTLTLPRTKARRHPAILLVSGSGPQNRDEQVEGHRPFLVLADYLTRLGFAVLRVDDRGVGRSSGNADLEATTADYIEDALAGVAYLKSRRDIDACRIGILGHSEGGVIAPAAAARSPEVAFVIMLAGTGVPGAEALLRQSELIAQADGVPAELLGFERELNRKSYEIVVNEPDDAAALAALTANWEAARDEALASSLSAELKAQIQALEAEIHGAFVAITTPWFRYFLAYDPAPALRSLHVPALALNGTHDLQVDAQQNLPAIEEALRAGTSPEFSVRALPDLNHLFQTAPTGSPSEYWTIEETIAPRALHEIGAWLRAQRLGCCAD
jgi:pimeloyl-ACP methyl ester carboxylesterase